MNELWFPWKTRRELAKRQEADSWMVDDEDFDAVDRYLAEQHRRRESDASTSLSSSPLWTQVEGKKPWDLSSGERNNLQKQCQKLYYLSPFAGNIIDNYSFYTVGGDGIQVEWTNDLVADWWSMLAQRNKWIWLNKDIVTLTYITGEVFIVLFPLTDPDNGVQKEKLDLVEVHPTEIEKVVTAENDLRVIQGYQRQMSNSKTRTYLPEDTIHFKIRNIGGSLRGRPLLERVLRPLALYDDWLGSRADLNRMRARIPLIRYRSGLKKTGFPIRSLPEPGTVIDAHEGAERWEFPSLNIQSGDAAQDAQEFKLYISAGVNLPAYMVTGEGSTAEIIGSTPLMLFESMQGIFRTYFEELFKKLMPVQYEAEKPIIIFPEVDLRDFDRKARAIMEEFNSGLRSRRSSQIALGLKPEEEEEWMQKELGLTEPEVEQIPESLLRKIVSSVLFHAPAVKNGAMTNQFLQKLTAVFEERGFL